MDASLSKKKKSTAEYGKGKAQMMEGRNSLSGNRTFNTEDNVKKNSFRGRKHAAVRCLLPDPAVAESFVAPRN